MAHEDSTRAVVTALAGNLGIAISKFAAAALTGSSSMLAEGVHSMADSMNQVLLLIGGRQARREATDAHPFGYARERYIYAFLVSVVLFSIGGVYAVYEGIHKILVPSELSSPLVAIVVLLISAALEGYALRTAMITARAQARGARPHPASAGAGRWWAWWGAWHSFIRRAKAPELPTILLEDSAAVTGLTVAMFGVLLTLITGNGVWDGIATVCIGLLLIGVAYLLATETKSLLVGEAASPEDQARIRAGLLSQPLFNHVVHLRTMHLGPDELLITAKVTVDREDDAEEISVAIDAAERVIRAELPTARYIFIEPDLYRPAAAPDPPLSGHGDTA